MEEETVMTRIAQRLLDDVRVELARADHKAFSVLGPVSALIAVGTVMPHGRVGQTIAPWGWACGLSLCVLAMISLMLVALPRQTRGSGRQVVAYFGEISRIRDERDMEELLRQLAERPSDAVLGELKAISKIVATKYRFAWFGILCAVAGGTLLVMSGI